MAMRSDFIVNLHKSGGVVSQWILGETRRKRIGAETPAGVTRKKCARDIERRW